MFKPTRMIDTLSSTSSGSHTSEIKEENEIQRYITTNNNVGHLVRELLRDAGSLGPLEQPYDLKTYESHPLPDSSFNENDPWKIPIDAETSLRLVEFVENDKENGLLQVSLAPSVSW